MTPHAIIALNICRRCAYNKTIPRESEVSRQMRSKASERWSKLLDTAITVAIVALIALYYIQLSHMG